MIDLAGQRFGDLTVVSQTDERFHRSVVWRCRCDCGNEVNVPAMYLRSGRVSKCEVCAGAVRRKTRTRGKKHTKPRKNEDLTGQLFGELTAIRPTDKRKNGSVVWECKCSCGETTYVMACKLKNGNVRSCGHLVSKAFAGNQFRAIDITGRRSGRLVADHPLKSKDGAGVLWLCRCDCGGVSVCKTHQINSGKVTSCGCARRIARSSTYNITCPSCGGTYRAETLENAPQFCPECAAKYADRSYRVCAICKKLFPSPPSSNDVSCSPECRSQWRSIRHKGIRNAWNTDAKQRLSERGQTENLKLGLEAAKRSPVSGRFETNQNAKIWTLVDPTGREYVVRNLRLWAREHTELFGKPPGDRSADQIASGFRAVAGTLAGKPRRAPTYFGWTLKCLPEKPEE